MAYWTYFLYLYMICYKKPFQNIFLFINKNSNHEYVMLSFHKPQYYPTNCQNNEFPK